MNFILKVLPLAAAAMLAACAANPPAPAADGPPSEASVRELLDVTQGQKLIDGIAAQVDSEIQATIKRSLGSAVLSGEQQAIVDDMRAKIVGAIRDELKWESLEPKIAAVYERAFTQREVDGLTAFYKTDVGRSVVSKLPEVSQYSLLLAQANLAEITPKLREIERDTMTKLRAARRHGPQSGAAAPWGT